MASGAGNAQVARLLLPLSAQWTSGAAFMYRRKEERQYNNSNSLSHSHKFLPKKNKNYLEHVSPSFLETSLKSFALFIMIFVKSHSILTRLFTALWRILKCQLMYLVNRILWNPFINDQRQQFYLPRHSSYLLNLPNKSTVQLG